MRLFTVIVEISQALVTPAIALGAVVIARQQKKIAEIKLQNDLFEKRFAVFEAARDLIVEACGGVGDLKMASVYSVAAQTADAIFLFDDSVVDYLRTIRKQATLLSHTQKRRREAGNDIEEARAAAELATRLGIWFFEQDGPMIEVFRPFLQLGEHRRPSKAIGHRRFWLG